MVQIHVGRSQERIYAPCGSRGKNIAGSMIPPNLTTKRGLNLVPQRISRQRYDRICDPIGYHAINELADMCTGLSSMCSRGGGR